MPHDKAIDAAEGLLLPLLGVLHSKIRVPSIENLHNNDLLNVPSVPCQFVQARAFASSPVYHYRHIKFHVLSVIPLPFARSRFRLPFSIAPVVSIRPP